MFCSSGNLLCLQLAAGPAAPRLPHNQWSLTPRSHRVDGWRRQFPQGITLSAGRVTACTDGSHCCTGRGFDTKGSPCAWVWGLSPPPGCVTILIPRDCHIVGQRSCHLCAVQMEDFDLQESFVCRQGCVFHAPRLHGLLVLTPGIAVLVYRSVNDRCCHHQEDLQPAGFDPRDHLVSGQRSCGSCGQFFFN